MGSSPMDISGTADLGELKFIFFTGPEKLKNILKRFNLRKIFLRLKRGHRNIIYDKISPNQPPRSQKWELSLVTIFFQSQRPENL